MEQNLTTADQLIIALYFVGMIVVGLVVGKRVKSSDDYSVAGRSLKMPLLAGTLIGSAVGASATFGKAGKAYEVGFIILFSWPPSLHTVEVHEEAVEQKLRGEHGEHAQPHLINHPAISLISP